MADPKFVRIVISGTPDTLEILSAELFDAGASGLVEEPGAVVAYPANEDEQQRFLEVVERHIDSSPPSSPDEVPQVTIEPIEGDWQAAWQKELVPQKISRSFTLRPTHCPLGDGDDGKGMLWFEPDASFGSGDHPTTQLAASWIEEFVSAHPVDRCFDVGTGTGVLCLVAVRSGAQSALGVDTDEVAVRSAEKNVSLNGEEKRVQIALGSADFVKEAFPLVMANINTPILLELCEPLCARVAAGGTLLLTGLLLEDVEDIEESFSARGLSLVQRDSLGEWALLIFKR